MILVLHIGAAHMFEEVVVVFEFALLVTFESFPGLASDAAVKADVVPALAHPLAICRST